MEVYQVAGHDSMLFNLGGAHEPYFTRNVIILTDDSGRRVLLKFLAEKKLSDNQDSESMIIGSRISEYKNTFVLDWLDK
jgi:glucarate dehydratase